jgi:hypothetical protein
MTVIRGMTGNGSGRGRPLHTCTGLLVAELVPGFFVFVVFGVFQVGERVMWIWLFRADVGIMYQVSVSIT